MQQLVGQEQMRRNGGRTASQLWVCLVLLCAVVIGCGPKRPQQPIQGEVVKSISFQGNSGYFGDVPDSALREAMEQRQSAGMWWLDPNERAVTLDRKALSKDAWRIETFYANNGYFDAKVRGWDVITLKKGDPKAGDPKDPPKGGGK